VAKADLRPDAAHQQPIVAAELALVDVDVVDVQVRQMRPVLVVCLDERRADLVDNLVGRVLLDEALDALPFVWLHLLLGDRVPDELKPLADDLVVCRGAVLPEEELDHERRHAERAAHAAQEILANHKTRKEIYCESIELVEEDLTRHGFKLLATV